MGTLGTEQSEPSDPLVLLLSCISPQQSVSSGAFGKQELVWDV